MTLPVPSSRLVGVGAGLAAASMVVLAVPGLWPVLLAANLAVALVAVVDLLLTPGPSALRAVRLAPERLAVLRQQSVTLLVRNDARVPLWVRLREAVPLALGGAEVDRAGWVPAGGEARWEYPVAPTARGRHPWAAAAVRYRSVLGFWERPAAGPAAGEVRVYPAVHLVEQYHLLARADRLAALGLRRQRHRGGMTEFESLREYVTGDDTRQIDWSATARRSRLIVRNREAERNQTVLLLLDCGRLMNATEGGVSKLDHAVNTALLLAHVALARGDRVGLCAFSAKPHLWLPPRGGAGQQRLIADALYDLRGDYSETDHGRCLRFVAAHHPKRSLLVVVTDFVDATTAAGMVAHLGLAARRHVVLFAALTDAFLHRAAAAPAATDRQGFHKATAVELLRERREVLERVRQAGGLVVDAAPADLTPPVLNRYLEVVLGGRL